MYNLIDAVHKLAIFLKYPNEKSLLSAVAVPPISVEESTSIFVFYSTD
jgi:hypothetical protein